MKGGSFLLLLLFILCCKSSPDIDKYWYTTTNGGDPSSLYTAEAIDFRGCFDDSLCLFVSRGEGVINGRRVARYIEGEQVWVLALLNINEFQVVFGERPELDDTTNYWVSPVSSVAVKQSVFNRSEYSEKHSAEIQNFVDSMEEKELRKTVDLLSAYHTRLSTSQDAVQVSHFLEEKLVALGCQNVQRTDFRKGYSPNVVCSLPGIKFPSEYVVLGAHYDDRATSSKNVTQRAPGADDNGSGTSALLEILSKTRHTGITFERALMFAFFSGEEQGLYGSDALAGALSKNKSISVHAMINLDMIGVPQKGEEKTIWWTGAATSPSLTSLGIDLTRLYLEKDTVVKTEQGCCSDNQPFHERGIAAAGLFESKTVSNNPNYHRGSDLPETLTYSHVLRNCKATAALMATIALPNKR